MRRRPKATMVDSRGKKERVLSAAPYIFIGLILVSLPTYADLSLVSLFTRILIYGLLVMSLDLLVGFTGLFAFGQAALFGVAAYTTGIMVVYFNITSFWLAAPAGVLMATIAACVFGIIALRVSGMYFLLITLALGQLVWGIVNSGSESLRKMTGANNGLGGIPYPDIGFSFAAHSYYYFTLAVFVISGLLLYGIVKSPFGYSLLAIRESQVRARALGYNTWAHSYVAFIVSGVFAGIAGVLYIYFEGFISPEAVGVGASGLLWLMLIIGGTGTLWGGFVGAAVILSLQYFVAGITPERWPLIMGICFVVVVMFLRRGILPWLAGLWKKVSDYGSAKG